MERKNQMIPLFTKEEYEFILESNKIEAEPGVDFDHLHSFMDMKWKASESKTGNVNQGMILEWHRKLMKNKLRRMFGEYRKCAVQVGGKLMPNPVAVPHLMDEWIESFNKMDKTPWEYHKAFENIHPFVDGNGRTGRLLWAFDLLRRGKEVYPILNDFHNPDLVAHKDERWEDARQRYYQSL